MQTITLTSTLPDVIYKEAKAMIQAKRRAARLEYEKTKPPPATSAPVEIENPDNSVAEVASSAVTEPSAAITENDSKAAPKGKTFMETLSSAGSSAWNATKSVFTSKKKPDTPVERSERTKLVEQNADNTVTDGASNPIKFQVKRKKETNN